MNAVLKPTLSHAYYVVRGKISPELMLRGSILTAESAHPFVVRRTRPGSITEVGFKMKLHESQPDAPLSPIFLNLRTPDNPKAGPLTPEIVEWAAWCMVELAKAHGLRYHGVVGVPRAGDPFAAVFAKLTGIELIGMHKSEQGGTRHIAGVKNLASVSDAVRKVVLVDDLATKAGSKLEAIKNLRDAGFEVVAVLTLVDREQGARQELAKEGVVLISVFTITELLDEYVRDGCMSAYMRAKIGQYLVENS